MTRKSIFSIVLLLIAGLAPPMVAEAQVPTITAIQFYKAPELMTDYSSGRAPVVLKSAGDQYTGGTPTGTPVTADDIFKAGDVIGIAITLSNVKKAWPNIKVKFEKGTGAAGYSFGTRAGADQRSLPTPRTQTELYPGSSTAIAFTMYYGYRVQAGDEDKNGGWFDRDNNGAIIPFNGDSNTRIIEGGNGVTYNWADDTTKSNFSAIKYTGSEPIWPKIEGVAPTLAATDPIQITSPDTPKTGRSLWHTVRRTGPADGQHYTLQSDENEGKQVSYYNQGDTLSFHLKFSKFVKAASDTKLYLNFDGWTRAGTRFDEPAANSLFATLRPGSGDGTSDTLIFDYTVQPHDDAFDLGIRPNGMELITDVAGNPFDHNTALRPKFYEYYGWENFPISIRGGPSNYATTYRGTNFLIDTLSANVRITGLITDETHDAQGRRTAHVNFEDSVGTRDTSGEGIAPDTDVAETAVQTGAFEVEIRFFNYGTGDGDGVLADDPQGFTAEDIHITDASGTQLSDWTVSAPVLIGLDHRDPGYHGDSDSDGSLNKAKNPAAFLVYKATITPALGFQGDVAISLPAGATQDIAGNGSMASNVLTVPVSNPLRVVETPEIVAPEAGAYTVEDKIEVSVTYDREGLHYIGDAPPYLTLYLGEEVPANARHATWAAAEDANSTKVTFEYTVALGDVADAVRVAETIGLTVPRGTRLVDATGSKLLGSGEQAKDSGEGLEQRPAPGQQPLEDSSGRQVSPVVQETPVLTYLPVLEEAEPKSAATDVPRSPIVFNELGNGSGDTNDWLELRNVTGSAVSLKEWELSVVQDGKKEDTSLIVFPDVSVPANGLLLITNSEPTAAGNVLAGGDDITTSTVEKEGSSHQYLVNAGLSLPDDGKFLLILRNAKEKLGKDEAFVDVAGGGGNDTDAFIREQTGLYDTHVWPLQVLEAPGGDTEDALGSGKVWQRAKADIVGYHKDAWAEAAFTGLGYDRKVLKSAATAGTPGYPNGAVKPGSATPKGSITVSEIMVDSGGGTLPQWIELYNKSKTDAINLNRWKLEIQNVDSEDLVGRPIVTLTLQEKVIQPNQTLLIVAGPARPSSGAYLPADRVYDLLALHEKNLRIKRARDTFLSAEGIYLKLWDSTGTLVDEVGNTDGNRRTKDEPAWPLAMSAEEGVRSSLIRRYTKGTSEAEDGTEKGTWVLAANVKKVVDGELHWGSAEDIGTPGYRRGGALPVELSSFNLARTEAGAVVVTWTTESEVDNAGFNLRRSEKRDGGFTLLNPALIAGAGTTGERQTYTFTDTSAKPGIEYYYQIEEVAFDGKPETLVTRMLPGPVSAANRALTTFGELKRQKE